MFHKKITNPISPSNKFRGGDEMNGFLLNYSCFRGEDKIISKNSDSKNYKHKLFDNTLKQESSNLTSNFKSGNDEEKIFLDSRLEDVTSKLVDEEFVTAAFRLINRVDDPMASEFIEWIKDAKEYLSPAYSNERWAREDYRKAIDVFDYCDISWEGNISVIQGIMGGFRILINEGLFKDDNIKNFQKYLFFEKANCLLFGKTSCQDSSSVKERFWQGQIDKRVQLCQSMIDKIELATNTGSQSKSLIDLIESANNTSSQSKRVKLGR